MPLRTSGQRKVASYLSDGAQMLGALTQAAGAQIKFRDGTLASPPAVYASETTTAAVPYRSAAGRLDWPVTGADILSIRAALLHSYVAMSAGSSLSLASLLKLAEVTPTVLAANTNNWSPGNATIVRVGVSANVNVTGMLAGSAGEMKILTLVPGAAFSATLTNEDALSTAGNRWTTDTGASLVLGNAAGLAQIALAVYDGTTSRWRVSIT